jgi:hypothetical protein
MDLIPFVSNINYFAVIVAALVHTVIGLIWFQPWFFGQKWAALTNKSLNPATKWIPAGLLGHVVMILVLAMIINMSGATTFLEGGMIGAIVCVGFMATLETGELIWEKIPFKLFLIRVGNQLLGLFISGGILAIWK